MYCQECGKLISDTAVFCRFCGSKVHQPQSRQTGQNPSEGSGQQTQGQPGRQMQGHVQRQSGYPTQSQEPQYTYDLGGYRGYGTSGQSGYPNPGVPTQPGYPNPGVPVQPGYPGQGTPNQPMGGGQYQDPRGNYLNGRPGANIYQPTRPMQPVPGAMQMAGGAMRGGARAAGEASKLKILGIIAAALIAIVMMLYFLFFKAGTPEDTVAKMEDALNHMDQAALLECFDGQTQQMYSGALGLAGSLSGLPLGDLSDLAAGLGGMMAGAGLTPKFALTVVDVEYSGTDNCLVTVNFSMSFQGETENETQMLPMTKDGRNWVISMAAMQDMQELFY